MSRAVRATADAVVIGGGVIGTSTALNLARGGRHVHVIDANPSVGLGSTSSVALESDLCNRPFANHTLALSPR